MLKASNRTISNYFEGKTPCDVMRETYIGRERFSWYYIESQEIRDRQRRTLVEERPCQRALGHTMSWTWSRGLTITNCLYLLVLRFCVYSLHVLVDRFERLHPVPRAKPTSNEGPSNAGKYAYSLHSRVTAIRSRFCSGTSSGGPLRHLHRHLRVNYYRRLCKSALNEHALVIGQK